MSSNPSRPIVVDDLDSQVRYTGQGWFQDSGSQDKVGNFGPTYQRSLHGTNSNGSFSYAFNGTSIRIFGTTHILNSTGVIDPHWECFVDKISIGATKPFAFPENNWLLCEQRELNDGPHEITVNVTTNGQTFWFDYLQYTLSSGVSLDTAVVLVENSDPGLVFDSSWRALGGTANMTQSIGSQVSFNFTGTSLSWLGFIPTEFPHNASTGTFSIDGGSPQTFPLNGLPPGPGTTVYNQIFFTTPQLPAGPHTLLVTYTGTSQQTPLTLDYIYMTNTSTPASPISNSSSTPFSSQSSTSTPQISDNPGPPVGAIVGGVIGGLALIVIMIFLFWWHRRLNKHDKHPPPSSMIPPMEVTPFMSPYGQQSPMADSHNPSHGHHPWLSVTDSGYHASASTSSQGQNPSQPEFRVRPPVPLYGQSSPVAHEGQSQSSSSASRSRHNPSSSTSSGSPLSGYDAGAIMQTRAMRKHNEATLEPVRRPVVHQDSGVRLHYGQNTAGVVEDIPPGYTPT